MFHRVVYDHRAGCILAEWPSHSYGRSETANLLSRATKCFRSRTRGEPTLQLKPTCIGGRWMFEARVPSVLAKSAHLLIWTGGGVEEAV
jgi:hypothetical protein